MGFWVFIALVVVAGYLIVKHLAQSDGSSAVSSEAVEQESASEGYVRPKAYEQPEKPVHYDAHTYVVFTQASSRPNPADRALNVDYEYPAGGKMRTITIDMNWCSSDRTKPYTERTEEKRQQRFDEQLQELYAYQITKMTDADFEAFHQTSRLLIDQMQQAFDYAVQMDVSLSYSSSKRVSRARMSEAVEEESQFFCNHFLRMMDFHMRFDDYNTARDVLDQLFLLGCINYEDYRDLTDQAGNNQAAMQAVSEYLGQCDQPQLKNLLVKQLASVTDHEALLWVLRYSKHLQRQKNEKQSLFSLPEADTSDAD